MFSTLLSLFGGKNLLFISLGLLICGVFAYQTMQIENLQVELQDSKTQTLDTQKKLQIAYEDNKKIIDTYSQNIETAVTVAKAEATNVNAKENVVVKYKTLIKEVEKKQEVKQNENIDNNFVNVGF